jgi:hypothetical protein
MREQARAFSWPDASTLVSWAAMASNVFSAVVKGLSVIRETCSAKSAATPALQFSPVPTAVPPCASRQRRGRQALTRATPHLIYVA